MQCATAYRGSQYALQLGALPSSLAAGLHELASGMGATAAARAGSWDGVKTSSAGAGLVDGTAPVEAPGRLLLEPQKLHRRHAQLVQCERAWAGLHQLSQPSCLRSSFLVDVQATVPAHSLHAAHSGCEQCPSANPSLVHHDAQVATAVTLASQRTPQARR